METRFPIRVYHGRGRSSSKFFSTPSRSSTHCSGRAVLTHENEFWQSCLFCLFCRCNHRGTKDRASRLPSEAATLKNPLSYCLQLFCSSLISHKKLSFIEISKSGQLSKASTDLFNVPSTTQYQTVVFTTIFPSCPSSHIQRTFIFSFGRCVKLCD